MIVTVATADGGHRDRRPQLVGADAEHLAEQQRVDLWGVLDAEAEKQGAEREHQHERQRSHRVAAPASAERADSERPEQREDAEADDRVDADQAGAGSAREGTVGNRVSNERRAAQHDEESDHAGDNRDDARHLPGIDHESGEHRSVLSASAIADRARCFAMSAAAGHPRGRRSVRTPGMWTKTIATTKKLTGQPLPFGGQ